MVIKKTFVQCFLCLLAAILLKPLNKLSIYSLYQISTDEYIAQQRLSFFQNSLSVRPICLAKIIHIACLKKLLLSVRVKYICPAHKKIAFRRQLVANLNFYWKIIARDWTQFLVNGWKTKLSNLGLPPIYMRKCICMVWILGDSIGPYFFGALPLPPIDTAAIKVYLVLLIWMRWHLDGIFLSSSEGMVITRGGDMKFDIIKHCLKLWPNKPKNIVIKANDVFGKNLKKL